MRRRRAGFTRRVLERNGIVLRVFSGIVLGVLNGMVFRVFSGAGFCSFLRGVFV